MRRVLANKNLARVSSSGYGLHVPSLPNASELREDYSICRNQTKKVVVQALGSCLYDLLNDVVLNFEVTSLQAEKQAVFTNHPVYWRPKDILIYDRVYADFSVIAYHIKASRAFIIRCPLRGSFKGVDQLLNSQKKELTVTLAMTDRTRRWVRRYHLPTRVRVRLVKIPLPNGETEILLTSLMDATRYSQTTLSELYHLQWGVETYFHRLKNQLEVERFNATKQNGVLQEIYACVLVSTVSSLLSKEVALTLTHRPSQRTKPRKYIYQLNQARSLFRHPGSTR